MTGHTASDDSIRRAAAALRQGRLVAFPTETVYGLGALASDARAVASIFETKARPRFNPLIIHTEGIEEAGRLGVFNERARLLAERFWPGPLSLVLPRAAACPVAPLACAGLETIALRVPLHPVAQSLLRELGAPIAAPSANVSARLSPTRAAHVAASLKDASALEMILDGGACAHGLESTIIACADNAPPTLLRTGAVARGEIEAALGVPLADAVAGGAPSSPSAPLSPGRLRVHYAPRKPLRLNAVDARPDEGLLGFGSTLPSARVAYNLSATGNLREAAACFFDMLHTLDARDDIAAIAVMPIPDEGLGEALNDRLRRAVA